MMTVPIDSRTQLSRSAVALYIQLATLFRRYIESGRWQAGSQIPTIEELMAEHGVARATIRQALGLLEAEGLITRHRAKGTFVAERGKAQVRLDVTTDLRGMLNAREGASIEVLRDSVVDTLPVWPHDIGVVAPRYRLLKRRHTRNGEAFLLADVYIDAKLAAKLPKPAFNSLTAMRLASSIPGIRVTQARQTITVGSADMEIAELLGLPLNAPLCFIDRSAVDQHGRLILVSKGAYRGDVVRIEMEIK
ncbi:GntR family transcriptional regulator [Bradyrhizobium manausense]